MIDQDKKIMRGEFRGDFTRDTFDPMKAFSRVLMQQGRVQLDADWNEQVSILLHSLRNMACDLGGPHWGPADFGDKTAGFRIIPLKDTNNDFCIGEGHYYVNGILCEAIIPKNGKFLTYRNQPDYPVPDEEQLSETGYYLVYLDVWERHISYVEDDSIREVALSGPDTASRAKITCQVKTQKAAGDCLQFKDDYYAFIEFLKENNIIRPASGTLKAMVAEESIDDKSPCRVSPESRYRGTENQLYRVEIHQSSNCDKPTFKWSRENGSVIFPILLQESKDDTTLMLALEHLGRDDRFTLKANDWVEIVDDDYILQSRAKNLLKILSVDHEKKYVTLKLPKAEDLCININTDKSPYLRRWDQKTGDGKGIPIIAGRLPLENGIQIEFPECDGKFYQTGDYWLIPARTETGNIEWPKDEADKPKAMLPHGVIHHYAPLAIIKVDDCEGVELHWDLRQKMKKITMNVGECAGAYSK